MADEIPLILRCPVCAQDHAYQLRVQRSKVHGVGPGTTGLPTERRTFVQLFMCPTRGERFQAELTLPETALTRIRSLEVADG
jgi:hypothetical protein